MKNNGTGSLVLTITIGILCMFDAAVCYAQVPTGRSIEISVTNEPASGLCSVGNDFEKSPNVFRLSRTAAIFSSVKDIDNKEPKAGGPIEKIESQASLFPQSNVPGSKTSPGPYVFPSKEQRFKRYVWDTIGPYPLLGAGAGALIDHAYNNPSEWGKGGDGYGKRFASSLGKNVIDQSVKYGLGEALHQDNRFYRSSKRSFGGRVHDALLQSVTSRTRSGATVVSAPKLTGYVAGGLVQLAWLPDRLTFRDGLRSSGYSLLTSMGFNLVQEFILHR